MTAAVAVSAGALPIHAQDGGPELDWLRDNAVPIRSVEPDDVDFSDLAGFGKAIGDARVVLLGENSHGAGSSFAAKVRLVRYLFEELDFDVLAWESGMFGVESANQALANGDDPTEAARLGVFRVWSWAQEVTPLFDYVATTHASARPLEMAGFDVQFSGDQEYERLRSHLIDLIGQIPTPDRRASGLEAVGKLLTLYEYFRTEEANPTLAELEDLRATADDVAAALPESPALRDQPRELALLRRVVGNLVVAAEIAWVRAAEPDASRAQILAWNLRDDRNASNLVWLAEERYPGRRIVVWAHNGHVMNAYGSPDWSAVALRPIDGGTVPSGVHLKRALGSAVYTVGFTAFSGEHGWATGNGDTDTIPLPPPDSFEALLHQLGNDHTFLDLRSVSDTPTHWARQRRPLLLRGLAPDIVDDWTQVLDGLFFTDKLSPATRIEGVR